MFIQIFDIVNCYSNSKNKPFLYINSSISISGSSGSVVARDDLTFGWIQSGNSVTVYVKDGWDVYRNQCTITIN